MSLRFEHSFVVKSAPDRVWAYLTDPYRVAPALPGASITGKAQDGSYGGAITMKVGPVSAKYRGTLRFETLDVANRTAVLAAKGQDVSGRGGADMRMESRLIEKQSGETEVLVVAEVNVTGILAQFGRGLIQDVSNQMFQRFTIAVRSELEQADAPSAATAVAAVSPAAMSVAASSAEIGAAVGAPAGAADVGSGSHVGISAGPADRASVAPNPSASAARPPDGSTVAPSPPIEVLSFGARLFARAVGRMIRRPWFWVVVLAVAGLGYWLIR